MADNVLQLIVNVDTGQANVAIQGVNAGLGSVEKSALSVSRNASRGIDGMSYSMMEARETVRGLGEEIGIRLPRFVRW